MSNVANGTKDLEYFDPYKLIIIGLDTEDGKEHPLYDERINLPIDEALVKNITVYGVQVPIIVRLEGGKAYVVDGRQRVRASREVAKRQGDAGEHVLKVPGRLVRGDDARISGIMISTGLRQDDDILTKGRKAIGLLGQLHDINEVAIAFGRTPQTIRNWMSLVEADPAIHEAIQNGAISAAAAVELAALDRKDQTKKLDLLLRASNRTDGTAKPVSESQVKRLKKGEGAKPTARVGVRRTWLKAALKTKAASRLTPDQKSVLTWFVASNAEADDWFALFSDEAAKELDKPKKGRGRPKKTPEAE